MKKKKDKKPIGYHVHKRDKNENILSFRFFIYGHDPITNQKKNYTTVWELPLNLIGAKEKEIDHEWQKAYLAFKDEVKEKSKYVAPKPIKKDIFFLDYAREWKERILIKHPEGYNYYTRAEDALKLFELHFNGLLMKDMDDDETTPTLIQNFYDWLCTRTYRKNIVIVKKSIQHLIDERIEENNKLKYKDISNDCGFNKMTLVAVRQIGRRIELSTAKAICKYFNISFDKYFELKTQDLKYSKAANSSVKRILVSILYDAKKKRAIKENYATKQYTDALTGTEREKEIYDEDEATEFVVKLMTEQDIRKKSAFAIYLFMGLRSSEVCGLEWKDIDFENRQLSVNRNFSYFGKRFGNREKSTKTKSSKRTITMPSVLMEILREYKIWWNKQKILYGDLWENTDKLMIRDDGKTRVPTTLAMWLRNAQFEYGMKHIPPHSLRHTNATLQLMAGVPIKTIAERLGHADASITLNVYSHFLKKSDLKAADTIDNIMCKKVVNQ